MASKEELLDVLRTGLPPSVISARLTNGEDGGEFLEACAELFALVGRDSIDNGIQAASFLAGVRGKAATCAVQLRVTVAGADKTLQAGARFQPSGQRRTYVSLVDTVFPVGTTTQTVYVAGEWHGAGYNIAADEITDYISGTWVDASGAIVAEPTIVGVQASTAATDGRFASLDLLAAGRGVYPAAGEDVETLRRRAWEAPPGATPEGLQRIATVVFWESQPTATAPYQEVELREPGDVSLTFGDDYAWEDQGTGSKPQSYWQPAHSWVSIFLPELDALTRLGVYDESDPGVAYGDPEDAAYGEFDAAHFAIYNAVMNACNAAAAAGVIVFFYIGAPPQTV